MRRYRLVLPFLALALAVGAATTVLAQDSIPADATPGAHGTSGVPLGSIDPVAAPGHRLQVVELTWEPGAYTTPQA